MKFIITELDNAIKILNEADFMTFAKSVANENQDVNFKPETLEHCIHYVQQFCDNLDLHCLDGVILPDETAYQISIQAEEIYQNRGFQATIDYLETFDLPDGFCVPCDADMPVLKTETDCICGVCGSSINPGVTDAFIEYTIKTTGSGTREEIVKSLRTLADTIEKEYTIQTYATRAFEDPTLLTEITVEN